MDSVQKKAAENRFWKRILRYSRLSKNTLRDVDLCIEHMVRDVKSLCGNWEATKVSLLFNILSLSSDSLKRLRLCFEPELKDTTLLPFNILYISSIIEHLKDFLSLREVIIDADAGIELKSSSNSKCLQLLQNSDAPNFDDRESEVDEILGSSFTVLFGQVTRFTQSGFVSLDSDRGVSLSREAVRKLEDTSKQSLKDIEVSLESDDDGYQDLFSLVVSCPNLERCMLNVNIAEHGEGDEIPQVVFLESPTGSFLSNLRSLYITLWNGSRLQMNETFRNWATSGSLENLEMTGYFPIDPSKLDVQSLQSFLSSSSSSLSSLKIEAFGLTSGTISSELVFSNLEWLEVSGSIELLRFFSKQNYSSLEGLRLRSFDGYLDDQHFSHFDVLRILRSCRSSLQQVKISILGDNQSSREESVKVDDGNLTYEDRFSLPHVSEVFLQVDSKDVARIYSSLSYPNLQRKNLTLGAAAEPFLEDFLAREGDC